MSAEARELKRLATRKKSLLRVVLAMVDESKKTVFENWLAAYGTHLENVARGEATQPSENRDSELLTADPGTLHKELRQSLK